MIRKRGLLLGVALFAPLLLPACGSTDPTPTLAEPTSTPAPAAAPTLAAPAATPTPAPPTFEQEWEALKAAAREEGKMVLVTGSSASRGLVPVVRGVFGEQFGIEVIINGGSGSQHLARITAERAGGRYEVDVVIHGRTTMGERLGPAGVFLPVKEQLFHPDAIDPSNWWMNRFFYREPDGVEPKYSVAVAVRALKNPIDPGYNTEIVTAALIEEINSVWDFLDDRWKGQIISLSPLETGVGASLQLIYSHPGMGPDWIARFYSRELDVTFVGDNRQIVDSIAFGGHAFSIFDQGAGNAYVVLKDQGAPVDVWSKNLKEGGVVSTTGSWSWIGMMDRAPNPNAAKLFLNWWLTKEGQTAYNTLSAGGGQPPSLREDVPGGVTLPQERRDPGAVYGMASLDTSLPDLSAEAVEFAQRVFLER